MEGTGAQDGGHGAPDVVGRRVELERHSARRGVRCRLREGCVAVPARGPLERRSARRGVRCRL